MVQLTSAAIAEIKRLQQKQPSSVIPRLAVIPGGCLQWYYVLEFQSRLQETDHLVQCRDLSLAVAGDSLDHCNELVIDYSEDLMGGGFRFKNPHAAQSCGCGYSFAQASVHS